MDEATTVMAGSGIRQHKQSEKCDEQCDPLKGIESDRPGVRHFYDLRAGSSAAAHCETADREKGSVPPANLRLALSDSEAPDGGTLPRSGRHPPKLNCLGPS